MKRRQFLAATAALAAAPLIPKLAGPVIASSAPAAAATEVPITLAFDSRVIMSAGTYRLHHIGSGRSIDVPVSNLHAEGTTVTIHQAPLAPGQSYSLRWSVDPPRDLAEDMKTTMRMPRKKRVAL